MKKFELNSQIGTVVEYNGVEYTFTKPYYNRYIDHWSTNVSYKDNGVDIHIKGVVLRSGTPLLRQFNVPLPDLYLLSTTAVKEDITAIKHSIMIVND